MDRCGQIQHRFGAGVGQEGVTWDRCGADMGQEGRYSTGVGQVWADVGQTWGRCGAGVERAWFTMERGREQPHCSALTTGGIM